MLARALAALIALSTLGLGAAHAETTLTYRVSTGGMLAGTFSKIDIPQLAISLNGNDVVVVSQAGEKDGRAVKLSAGTVKDFTYKRLKEMVGQQMSVKISVTPVGAAPGTRCKLILDHAKLDKLTTETIEFKPSETPEFECS